MTRFNRNPFLRTDVPNVYQRELLDVVVLDEVETSGAIPRRARPKSKDYSLWGSHSNPWRAWSGALLLTVVVHVLFVGSLTLGTGNRASRPPEKEGFQAMGRNAVGTEPVSVLIIVPDKSIHIPDETEESSYTPSEVSEQPIKKEIALASTDIGVMATKPPSLEDFDESASSLKEAEGDGGEAALLFGRYMGQIKARIERAWSYPTAPAQQRFQCRAQIRQSRDGSVLETTLQQCGSDTQWQMSLVRAIDAASPLSAPPSEKVFSEVVTLNFTAQAQPVVSALVNDSVARSAQHKQ